MTTYFVGGGFDCWSPSLSGCSDSTNGIDVTNGAHADAILRDPATGLPTDVTTLWFHSNFTSDPYRAYDGDVVDFNNAAGTTVARLRAVSDGTYFLEYFDGAAWHSAPVVATAVIKNIVDIKIVIAGPGAGYIGWYVGSVLASELTGVDTSGAGSIRSVRVFSRQGYYNDGSYTDTIMASYNTLGHTVRRRGATGNGPEQQWTGDYTAINEGSTNDTTAISADTAAETSTFTADPLSATPAGSVIKCVALGMRIRASGDAPTKVAGVLTIGGTDYPTPGIVGSGGYTPAVVAFDVDPATGLAWASIDDANGNYGVKALA